MKKMIVAGAVITAAATGMAVSEADMFARMDANGDRKVTKEEYVSLFMATFSQKDANKDGVLTMEEFPYPASWKSADVDKDGKLTAEEFETLYSKQFDGRDKNKDGVVTMDEMIGGTIILG